MDDSKVNCPQSCDTFVVLPPVTMNSCIVFGKNSDRPADEIQEVVYIPAIDYPAGAKVQCTYIEIEQVNHTHAVILSKPAWMWGAEMGANEHGVCIGNEAVWTNLNGPKDEEEKLLGMDLLRLGLERASTALEAVHVIASLLEAYGQGGPCSDSISHFTYHNSFLIADHSEAWVLETAADLWAAERVTSGIRNISNELSIGTKIDLHSAKLKSYAQEAGLWDPSQGPLNFRKTYSDPDDDGSYRFRCGRNLLSKLSASGNFKGTDMFQVLRDKPSGICMSSGSFLTTGSQVSVLSPLGSNHPCCHWFTATPYPDYSIFKPFIFSGSINFPLHTVSPVYPTHQDPAKIKPRFKTKVDRGHNLYKHRRMAYSIERTKSVKVEDLRKAAQQLESTNISTVERIMNSFPGCTNEADELFKNSVEAEIALYKG